MSAPVHLFIVYTRSLFILVSCSMAMGIVVSRVYVFFEAYSQFTLQRVEEEWLRQSCQDPDFYSNMRQHTDLCALVEHNGRQWALLYSLNIMFTTSHVCGARPCIEYINDLVLRGIAWPVAIVACLFVVTVPSIISSMAGKSMWQALDSRARNTPADTYTRLHKMHEPNAPFYTTTTLQTDCYTDHDHREEEEIGGFDNNGEVGMVLRGGHTPSYGTDMSVYPRRRRDHPMI